MIHAKQSLISKAALPRITTSCSHTQMSAFLQCMCVIRYKTHARTHTITYTRGYTYICMYRIRKIGIVTRNREASCTHICTHTYTHSHAHTHTHTHTHAGSHMHVKCTHGFAKDWNHHNNSCRNISNGICDIRMRAVHAFAQSL